MNDFADIERSVRRRSLLRHLAWRQKLPDLSHLGEDEQWDQFVDVHEGRCGACRRGRDDVIDHDHCTGLIRGLLCRRCNAAAVSGGAHRNIWRVHGTSPMIAIYCQLPPAALMGMRMEYAHPFGYEAAPRLRDILWYAGPDGVEHDQIRRLGRDPSQLVASAIE